MPGTGSGSFENTGSVIESEGSNVAIEVPFDNQGSVSAQTGLVAFSGGGITGHTAVGSWSTSGSGVVKFNSGSYTWG